MVVRGLKKHLNLMKTLSKAKMKKVINGIFLKLMLNILNNYMDFTMI